MSSFIVIEGLSYLLVPSGFSGVVKFEVDSWAVPFLERCGNFSIINTRRPEDFAPVLRRREPRTGTGKTIRLPTIVAALFPLSDEQRFAMTLDSQRIIDGVKGIRVMSRPSDGRVVNCKLTNWTGQVILSDEDFERMKREIHEADLARSEIYREEDISKALDSCTLEPEKPQSQVPLDSTPLPLDLSSLVPRRPQSIEEAAASVNSILSHLKAPEAHEGAGQ